MNTNTKTRWTIRRAKGGFSLYEGDAFTCWATTDEALIYGANMLFGLGGQG